MKVKELIRALLEFNYDAEVYVKTDYTDTNSFDLSWISEDCSFEGKRKTSFVFIEANDN